MPGITIFKLFAIFGIVSGWSEKALEDGEITLTEAAELATDLGAHLGVPVRIEADLDRRVADLNAEPPETENPTPEIEEEQPPRDRPPPR